jgi:hypothetical protein
VLIFLLTSLEGGGILWDFGAFDDLGCSLSLPLNIFVSQLPPLAILNLHVVEKLEDQIV